jgi:hypothetical protein
MNTYTYIDNKWMETVRYFLNLGYSPKEIGDNVLADTGDYGLALECTQYAQALVNTQGKLPESDDDGFYL